MECFEATENEKNISRLDDHHIHVKQAIAKFEEVLEVSPQATSDKVAGQKMRSAIQFVRNFKSGTTDAERMIKMDHLIKMIEWGTITSISTDLNRMEKKLEKGLTSRNECFSAVLDMAEKYNSYFMDEEKEKEQPAPMIVLSESFA